MIIMNILSFKEKYKKKRKEENKNVVSKVNG